MGKALIWARETKNSKTIIITGSCYHGLQAIKPNKWDNNRLILILISCNCFRPVSAQFPWNGTSSFWSRRYFSRTYFPDRTRDRLSTLVAFSWAYTSWYFSCLINFIQFSTFLNWWRVTFRGWNSARYTCNKICQQMSYAAFSLQILCQQMSYAAFSLQILNSCNNVYNTQKHQISGFCPSSRILSN
jgi:hypothetical protein